MPVKEVNNCKNVFENRYISIIQLEIIYKEIIRNKRKLLLKNYKNHRYGLENVINTMPF